MKAVALSKVVCISMQAFYNDLQKLTELFKNGPWGQMQKQGLSK